MTEHPRKYEDWERFAAYGREIGEPDAPVRILEFTDLECPACRYFHTSVLPPIIEKFGGQVSVTLVHFPLAMHRFAPLAAKAAECAADQSRFAEYVAEVFAGQDSLGLKPWTQYAVDSGIGDTSRFAACVRMQGSRASLDSAASLGAQLRISATPTLFINGWRLVSTPTPEELTGMVKAVIAGRDPWPN